MSPRRRDVYRGKHRWRFPVTLVVTVVLLLVVAAVSLFYSLQKYAVYSQDGVTLAIPGLTEAPPEQSEAPRDPTSPTPVNEVTAELVVKEADYSGVDLQPGLELSALQGQYFSAVQLLAGVTETLTAARAEGAALVLEMKTPEGGLFWASGSEVAQAFGVNGQAELSELTKALKDKGYYLVAELSCCRDTLLSKRSPSLALKNTAGEPYKDELGGWLDPYGMEMRQYLLFLMEELAAAGFDEVLLSGLSFPANDGVVSYAEERIGASTPRAAVSGLAVWLARNAPEELRLSVLLEKSALYGTGNPEKESPQDAELFCRLFDRLYLRTDALSLASDTSALTALTTSDLTLRFVPIGSDVNTAACYVRTAAPTAEE